MIRTLCFFLAAALFAGTAFAQTTTTTPLTPLQRRLGYVDFGIAGIGQFNSKSTGVVIQNSATDQLHTISLAPGNTLGALANISFTPKPWFGIEFNYTYARYTETLTDYGVGGTSTPQPLAPGQIQTGVDEESLGYVITPRHQFFGLQPIFSLDAGTTRFRPTRGGGQSAPTQYRATYAYSAGLQKEFNDSHFGLRVTFRQAFFKAPDFLLNYLTINDHTNSIEPTAGFFVRF